MMATGTTESKVSLTIVYYLNDLWLADLLRSQPPVAHDLGKNDEMAAAGPTNCNVAAIHLPGAIKTALRSDRAAQRRTCCRRANYRVVTTWTSLPNNLWYKWRASALCILSARPKLGFLVNTLRYRTLNHVSRQRWINNPASHEPFENPCPHKSVQTKS